MTPQNAMTAKVFVHLKINRPRFQMWAGWFWAGAVFLLFLLSVAGLAHSPRRLELASHFRLQYAWAAALCGAWLWWRKSWHWAALALGVVAFNGLFIAPYYLGARARRTRPERRSK